MLSTARIEQTTAQIIRTTRQIHDNGLDAVDATLRVEQRIMVDAVESQVRLYKLETMMAKVLLETSFGQFVKEQTIQVIDSVRHSSVWILEPALRYLSQDPGHKTIESQYMSTQTFRLITLVQGVVNRSACPLDPKLWLPKLCLKLPVMPCACLSSEQVLRSVLGMLLQLQAPAMEMEFMDAAILGLSQKLWSVGMYSEAAAWELLVCDLLRRLLDEHNRWLVMPQLACSLEGLSSYYKTLGQPEDALRATGQALQVWGLLSNCASSPHVHVYPSLFFEDSLPLPDPLEAIQ
uniref:Uncharacterized protein n=1 Tax=Mycena chlorophos TaxID=658473 RepID=A0ABQ0L9K4_MYCCL|nr:predicted protein [Mycena chlorophos]